MAVLTGYGLAALVVWLLWDPDAPLSCLAARNASAERREPVCPSRLVIETRRVVSRDASCW